MQMASASSDEKLLTLRTLLASDSVALQKWGEVVNHIANQPGDVLRIKKMLEDGKFEEAVLQTLQIWWSHGRQRPDLAAVLEGQGLDALAAKVQESEYKLLVQEIGAESKRGTAACWFEVGQSVVTFTGRQHQLEAIHTKLGETHSMEAIVAVTISGLGGIGKSALARKYAFTYRDFYDGNVVWINAEMIESMRASFIRLARELGLQLGDQPLQEFLVEKVFGYFQNKKCLFIYDNVETLTDFKKFLPRAVDPSREVPYVVVTSRRTDLNPALAYTIRLDVLTTEEAVDLIQKMLDSRKENAMKLAHKLQRLPLALQQALTYIRDTAVGDDDESIAEYLKEFDKSEVHLLKDERFRDHDDYSYTTFATWQITLAKIREMKDGPCAIKVIKVLAYLNPDLINMEFVKVLFEEEARLGLQMLNRFSMIHVNEGRVVIHRLVQHVVRLSLSEQEEEEQLQMLATAIQSEFEKNKSNDVIRECTSHGLHFFPFQINRTHSEPMTANCDYFMYLCYYLAEYGNYVECLSISQKMASLYESIHGQKHGSTIIMKSRMAEAYYFLKKFVDSVQILNAILPDAKLVLGIEHSVTMHIQSKLADCMSITGDSKNAVQTYDEIIPIAERMFGAKSLNVLDYKFNKAIGLRRLGKLEESLEIWKEVEFGFRNILGDEHRDTILARNYIAACEVEKGYEQALGPIHPDTIRTRELISNVKIKVTPARPRKCWIL